jgi:hypothetical protein
LRETTIGVFRDRRVTIRALRVAAAEPPRRPLVPANPRSPGRFADGREAI